MSTIKHSGEWTAWRRWRRWVVIAVVVFSVYSLLGFFLVPWIVEGQIVKLSRAFLDRTASVERVKFNPFRLAATVEGFRLADKDAELLAAFDRLHVNLETSGVFRRALRFGEISLEGPVVRARILQDGTLSIADLLEDKGTQPEEEESAGPPRLMVDLLVVRSGHLEFADASHSPAFRTELSPLNLEVRDLVTLPESEGDHDLRIGFGENAELRWQGRQSFEPFRLMGRVETQGIDLTIPWEYVGTSLPLTLRRGTADADFSYDIQRDDVDGYGIRIADASIGLRDLALGTADEGPDWLAVDAVGVKRVALSWPEEVLEVEKVEIVSPRLLARRGEDGDLDWLQVLQKFEETPPGGAAVADDPQEPSPTWSARIALVEVTDGSVRFDDASLEPSLETSIEELNVTLENLSTDFSAPVTLRTEATVNRTAGFRSSGSLTLQPFATDLELRLDGLDVVPFEPYVSALPGGRVASAVLGVQGNVNAAGEPLEFTFDGSATLERLEIQDLGERRLVAWKRLGATGIRASGLPLKLRVKKVDVDEPYANLYIDSEGNVNLARLGARPADEVPAEGGLPSVEVVAIDLLDANVDFADESLILPFATKIHSGTMQVRDLSTVGSAPASINFEGRIDETGYANAEGALRLADPFASTEIRVRFRDVEMKGLTPYSAQFAGYALERGSLDVDIDYRIQDGKLVGNHDVVAKDLVLGDRIEGSSAATLPVRLAVALLKDKEGNIDLEVPIEGSVDSPEFAYRKVIWQAVKKILVNVAAAPFRAIGRLFGFEDEQLELVEFDPGESALLPVEQDKLSKLAAELAKRPELTLEIEGRFEEAADADALRRERLRDLLESRREEASEQALRDGAGTLDLVLEELYAEAFSPEALEAERLRFYPEIEIQEGESRRERQARERAAREAFDAPGFYESLRNQIREAQPVTTEDLRELAQARAESIAVALTADGGFDRSRVAIAAPAEAKKKKKGSDRIASEMTMAAEKASSTEE